MKLPKRALRELFLLVLAFTAPNWLLADDKSQSYEPAVVAAIHTLAMAGEIKPLEAVLKKHPEFVNARRGQRPRTKPDRTDAYTALHWAVAHERDQATELLLKHGADPNAVDGLGWTPLHIAAERGKFNMVKQLIEAGANPHAKTVAIKERFGTPVSSPAGTKPSLIPGVPARTPIDLARLKNRTDVVEFLSGKK
jgi:ankyrin repeat protein